MRPNSVSTKQERIATWARNNPARVFTALNHYLDYEWLLSAYALTRKDGAVGADGITSQVYAERLQDNLESLLSRLKSGRYQAPPVRRVYIPKSDGSQRALGIASFEDKIAQRAIVMLLEPLYEQTFKESSFGFRPGKSAHQSLQYLRNHIMDNGGRWLIDVDIHQYFDTIDRSRLRLFLNRKVTDGVIRKLIDKWLKAGILEDGKLFYQPIGTAQGGVASPLLSNIYLHYVIDEWFAESVIPRMQRRCSLTRFCDDLVMVFEKYSDCQRVYQVLGRRLAKFGLTLHAEKTRIIDFRFNQITQAKQRKSHTAFNFLGFTHVWKKSRNGKFVVHQRTAKERLAKAITVFNGYCKANRHKPLPDQYRKLCSRLRGHYAYFGITGNYASLRNLEHKVAWIWHKWLSKRSRQSKIPWEKFKHVLEKFPLPKPRIYHPYQLGRERTL